ncbi:restriction endonuclease [Legionella maioricensis]|uniref:Restriction endonuclease n=1 Tax=Legionella maioricensis TaxID=2896528 RepID=A0A9X2IBM8_9GAMM|nr:restriction endonuclease [Legionella maioricensis]MCL9682898.1 restriction endonuclease [Legionella maioricensis]MCL9686474.1 restriction endonuclease [Legionella maioricensis]
MSRHNYYRRRSVSNDFEYYSDMRVSVRAEKYKNFQFTSVFKPMFCEKHALIGEGQIYFNDLLCLLSIPSRIECPFNWKEVLKIRQFEAVPPKIEGLLTEPLKPEEPVEPYYDDIASGMLKIFSKPSYIKPDIKIRFLRDRSPKLATIFESLFIYVGKIWHNLTLYVWQWRYNIVERRKRSSKYYKSYELSMDAYNQNLANYNRAHSHWIVKRTQSEKMLKEALSIWSNEKDSFDQSAITENEQLIKLKTGYESGDKAAIEKFVQMILLQSPYPDTFPRHFETNYEPDSKIIIIDFQLPDFERYEILEETKQFKLKPVSKIKRKSIVEFSLPAIAIRTLYEVAITDEINAISSIVFNGWVNFIDKTNGHERYECILSVHATVDKIKKLIITNLDPKECFKSFKGVIAKNILEYIPVAPILVINKNDNRLIEGREIMVGLSPDHNLAAMDWNDFEHLIRELFEKEFSKHGAEVRITHASHDRGVDAIIYDPDPIRGGKFIIQAKRYTKLVDVSAVRDLYGAIQNESANRGILVTTSHYGPDAYEFAKDKNITLLTGENLLHLLEKHGYKFKIDIKEARKILNLK